MNIYVPRTCTEVAQGRRDNPTERPEPKPLQELADKPAVVLLGAPGAGKTTTFKQEAKEQAGCYVTARNFVTFEDRPEWHDKTLFIDGLDEMRAGAFDQRTPFDRIRAKLDQLGRPCFRLSCREADWFGATDRNHLESVSSTGKVLVLRLDPLSDNGIREILGHRGIDDVEGFISTAKHRDTDALLENPQTLEMLANAVAGGSWPETRTQTFELACKKLLSELNPEHQLAAPSQHSDAELLDAAGRICALLLLSGRARCAAMAGQTDADSISFSEISSPSPEILTRTIHTKLFKVEDGLAEPIHRHIAEFLAGRHLAGLITNGLPVGRILALITGEDGGLVSELRGIAAWLAAQNITARDEIIKRDPQGVVLYGDVKRFSAADKCRILTRLEQEAERDFWGIANNWELAPRWGDLATPDMENAFLGLLLDDTASDARQSILNAVLTAICQGATIPGLRPALMKLVRDEKRPSWIKELALDAYIKQVKDNDESNQHLKALLKDVHLGTVSDPNDQLLGCLLIQLYPKELRPSEIGRYFKVPKKDNFLGQYIFFWIETFAKRTTSLRLTADALDSFAHFHSDQSLLNKVHTLSPNMRRLPTSLLANFLTNLGNADELDRQRLFGWLRILFNIGGNQGSGMEVRAVRIWFENHPNHYKAIFKMAVDRSVSFWQVDSFLFHATPPGDFASWCIDQALKAGEKHLGLEYLEKAMGLLDASQESDDLSRNALEMRLAERPDLLNHYRGCLIRQKQSSGQQSEWEKRNLERQQRAEAEERKRSEQWRNVVKRHEIELRANHAPPGLLHELAKAYFGFFLDIDGNTGRERLLSLLGGDEHLTDLALNAFRESTKRKDLPQASEIFHLATQNQQHHLALPFMAGCKELADKISLGHPPLDRHGVRRALALHFIVTLPPSDNWLKLDPILTLQPDVVAESLIRAFRVTIHKRTERCTDLCPLADDPSYSEVARIAAPQLMEAFPSRCKVKQLKVLKQIIVAALQHCEEGILLKVLERKLDLKSLNTAQKVYWLAARLLRCPQSTTAPLTKTLTKALTGPGGERQTTHLAAFLTKELNPWIANLDMGAKELLVQAIGKLYRPYPDGGARWISEAEDAGRPLVHSLVAQIAATPTTQAAKVLEGLAKHPGLCHWHIRLRHAAQEQREVRREACFIHASPNQVQQTLDNSGPANVADLAALVVDYLTELGRRIRHGETSDWRQYWNTDAAKRPTEPKHEGLCRDALLSDLLLSLAPLGINAQPEGQYENDKRADIRVLCERLNVPIEVKNNYHRELWTALHDKLIGQYAQDPGANGHGIYLVFWFGAEWSEAAPPTGEQPKTAEKLQRSLSDTLSKAEARRISVLVIDVSKPATQPMP